MLKMEYCCKLLYRGWKKGRKMLW